MTSPPSENGPQGDPQDAMRAQVTSAWIMMLGQATSAGFTREQIITLTLDTAATILDSTANALWTEEATPLTERYARQSFEFHAGELRDDAHNWQDRETDIPE